MPLFSHMQNVGFLLTQLISILQLCYHETQHEKNGFLPISPVAISITWKMVPHEILLWFPVYWAMLVQKLHDATLASLSVLKKIKMASKMVTINKKTAPQGLINSFLCV